MKLSWPRRGLACAAAAALLTAGISIVSTAESAQAASPDVFAFVLWNGSTVVSSGTTPASTTVVPGGPVGQYRIVFPGKAVAGGVAHVTAINSVPHWCQIASFGPSGADEVVFVNCYHIGGVLDNTPFTAIFYSRTSVVAAPRLFGYVNSQANGTLISQYNSAGGTNVVTPGIVGQWTVKFPGMNTPAGTYGSLQATAVNPQVPARCKVSSWTSGAGQIAQVACYNSAGAGLNTQFTLTYQYQQSLYGASLPPTRFAYVWTGGAAGVSPTSYNSTAAPNAYTLGAVTPVTFPGMGAAPDNVQVTATGSNSDFCGLDSIWVPATVAKVNCFTTGGMAVTDASLVSYNSVV